MSLSSVVIPTRVEVLSRSCFAQCTGLKKVELSYGLERICMDCFDECYMLTNVNIPSSVSVIEEWAFDSCDLKEVFIPASVINIGKNAFSCSVYEIKFYCEASEKPSTWDENWYFGSKANVTWNYKK